MDDFQRAAAAARRRYTEEAWNSLPPREQAKEIYTELRRVDAERVARATVAHRPATRSRTALLIETQSAAHAD